MKTFNPRWPDFYLCVPVLILLGLGMVMVSSASGVQSKELYGDAGAIFFKQLVALGVGTVSMVIAIFVPHRVYRKKPLLLLGLVVVIALLIGVYFQYEAKGASRWYYIGKFGFQPSDLAKLFLIVFVAAISTAYSKKGPRV